MRRGEVRFVDFEPIRGAEANKTRPAVIVSNDGANATADRLGRGVVTVVPLTSNTERVYAFQVLLRAAAGMALGFAYFVVDNAALAMGNFGGYPPLLAAWAPFLLFLLVGETVLVRTEE